jgi:hypothetical protein
VFIKREKVEDFYKWQNVGSNVVESFSWKIVARNTKNSNIRLSLFDQVPVSENRDIQVDVIELSDGKLNKETGIVEWQINLDPGETKEFTLSYSVKYPKSRRLNLD